MMNVHLIPRTEGGSFQGMLEVVVFPYSISAAAAHTESSGNLQEVEGKQVAASASSHAHGASSMETSLQCGEAWLGSATCRSAPSHRTVWWNESH